MNKCKHVWVPDPPIKGESFCSECGTLFTGKGRPRKAHKGNDVLASIAGEMAGMSEVPVNVGRVTVPMDGQEIESAQINGAELVESPPSTPTWCRMAGRRIADAYVMLIEGGMARFARRKVKDPEDEDVKELGNALGEQMAIWFPDTEMTPATKIAIAAASVAATMVVGSTPITPSVQSASTPKPTADVARAVETPTDNEPRRPTAVKLPDGVF